MIGKALGPYEILELLGKGGMGEVYRAKDTRLGREVAIKVLPGGFADDPERLARFEREAKVLASLNHMNIATVHGFEAEGETRFLVMELVPGETLAERMDRAPVKLEETLQICHQIAEALEAAHESGVIHRDLKPANVKVTSEGRVKVLDFGLAKASEAESSGDLADSPTITADYTRPGVLLGTAAYMSPEQASGKPVDKRTDIWAFGVVFFEMLTGGELFTGETTSHVLAEVLKTEPDWNRLPAKTPPGIRRLLRRCLDRNPKQRLRDIGEARVVVKDALRDPEGRDEASPVSGTMGHRSRGLLIGAILATLAVAAAVWAWPRLSTLPTRWIPMGLTASGSPEMAFVGTAWAELRSLDLSPDGTRLVFVGAEPGGGTRLYLLSLDENQPVMPLEQTEGASSPTFSPSGDTIAYIAGKQLRRISADGSEQFPLAEVSQPYGIAWLSEDEILVSEFDGLTKVNAAFGNREPTEARSVGIGPDSWLPDPLPGGEWVLVSSYREFAVVSLTSGVRKTLSDNLHTPEARLLPSGDIAYFHRPGQLFVQPFDVDNLEFTGYPIQVLSGVRQGMEGQFAVSDEGTLVFAPGGHHIHGELTWVTLENEKTSLGFDAQSFGVFNLSPDSRYVAAAVYETNAQIWRYDLDRGNTNKLVTNGFSESPVWSPFGGKIAYVSLPPSIQGNPPIMWRPSAGEDPETLVEHGGYPTDWPREELLLITRVKQGPTMNDIWLWRNDATEEFLLTDTVDDEAVLSPEGDYIAYMSGDPFEIFVEPYSEDLGPAQAVAQQISNNGGRSPRWSPDGKRVYFMNERTIWAVDVSNLPDEPPPPIRILPGPFVDTYGHSFDVAEDPGTGKDRFLVADPTDPRTSTPTLTWVQNWMAEVEARLAEARRKD